MSANYLLAKWKLGVLKIKFYRGGSTCTIRGWRTGAPFFLHRIKIERPVHQLRIYYRDLDRASGVPSRHFAISIRTPSYPFFSLDPGSFITTREWEKGGELTPAIMQGHANTCTRWIKKKKGRKKRGFSPGEKGFTLFRLGSRVWVFEHPSV